MLKNIWIILLLSEYRHSIYTFDEMECFPKELFEKKCIIFKNNNDNIPYNYDKTVMVKNPDITTVLPKYPKWMMKNND